MTADNRSDEERARADTCAHLNPDCFDSDYAMVEAAFLRGLRSERERHRWIPVSERLPEESGDYLVAFYWGGISKIGYSKKHGEWNNDDSLDHDLANAMRDITHWMPLPPKPEEK